ncbi:hypothetical protein AGABI2DRAFT_152609 [Agaricus bisporus var. bisporus H97]|uniref:hypothetical protein n=1 Tax=Agaricus bisporus var. bisporus (strain H97 / ATCC MYA-4626 / FGSC 10389) TaxID=936046 RepID=UPI00029F6DCF|nr:hypothetical protein AGABI2DRAFT_152609 [Agaricus bisporus var. bisporus H97]EKV45296.1 hypothetical protein AGABI2DRAFT_152609 [Agaricus bisporus var. bisporus H97]
MLADEDDVFQDSNPVIVDFDVLEAAKENVQPLGTGRRVTALSAILSTPHVHREAKLSATRNRLRINVEIALEDEEGSEALDAYWRFINWTLDNYPQGHSAESGLLGLLEEATRVLKDHAGGKWKSDMKYLKLWLLYASYVERPEVIYKFLIVNEIGTGFALLYEEYAAVLERDGRRKEADDAYGLGIARRADPLDHLQERYNDFQKRMMSNMMLLPTPATTTITASSQKPRPALATTLKPSTSSSSTRPSSSSISRSVSTPLPMSSSSNSRLQVFVDPSGTESQMENSSDSWQDIGTRKSRVKENVPEVKKIGGTTLKQAGRGKRIASASASGSSSGSKIAVYRDSGPGDMPPPTGPPSKTKVAAVAKAPPPKTSRTASFSPFVDGPSAATLVTAPTGPPATPKFTPFKDDVDTISSPVVDAGLTDSVIKLKKTGGSKMIASTEAEALRKDPLKNYLDSSEGRDT